MPPHFEHKLFLTATPHNGYKESFSALLELLDDQRFARGVAPTDQLRGGHGAPAEERDTVDELGKRRFPKRTSRRSRSYTAEERDSTRLLREYTELPPKARRPTTAERFATEFVLKLLKKRLFSSPAAFAITLDKHGTMQLGDGHAPKCAGRRPSASCADEARRSRGGVRATTPTYRKHAGSRGSSEPLFRDLDPRRRRLSASSHGPSRVGAGRARPRASPLARSDGPAGRRVERGARHHLHRVPRHPEVADEHLRPQGLRKPSAWYSLWRHGDRRPRARSKPLSRPTRVNRPSAFCSPPIAASEGIDLQNHCHRLIHYEIPWNPNRLEQRNGRMDRHGQPARCWLITSLPPVVPEDANLRRFRRRTRRRSRNFSSARPKGRDIREDLGKVGPVIAAQVEEAMLGYRRTLNTAKAEAEAQAPVECCDLSGIFATRSNGS